MSLKDGTQIELIFYSHFTFCRSKHSTEKSKNLKKELFMERQDYIADFSTLKNAYAEVKKFLEAETYENVTSLKTTIDNDLGCSGDDNYELLIKFTEKYNLNCDAFDYGAHFLSEGEMFGSMATLTTIISLPFRLLKFITVGKINLLPPKGYWDRETLDLTFGDMVAWYLSKDFKPRADLNIMLPR